MTAFIEAYAEYLERMYDESKDLDAVDKFTVPSHIDLDGPIAEWADFR